MSFLLRYLTRYKAQWSSKQPVGRRLAELSGPRLTLRSEPREHFVFAGFAQHCEHLIKPMPALPLLLSCG